MVLWGTHGTCRSNAEDIHTNGFIAKPGRIGVGAYFWAAVENSAECRQLSHRLATKWATLAKAKGEYNGKALTEVTIVEVQVDVEEVEILGLDDPRLVYGLWSMLNKKLSELIDRPFTGEWDNEVNFKEHEDAMHGAIEAFILRLEERYGRKFKLVFKIQSCPKFNDPLLPFIGNYSCFAIRDTEVISDMVIT